MSMWLDRIYRELILVNLGKINVKIVHRFDALKANEHIIQKLEIKFVYIMSLKKVANINLPQFVNMSSLKIASVFLSYLHSECCSNGYVS